MACLLGDILPPEWPPPPPPQQAASKAKAAAAAAASTAAPATPPFPPPTLVERRSAVAEAFETCVEQFRRLVRAFGGGEGVLVQSGRWARMMQFGGWCSCMEH